MQGIDLIAGMCRPIVTARPGPRSAVRHARRRRVSARRRLSACRMGRHFEIAPMERLRSFLTNEFHANLVLRFSFSNDSAMVVGQAGESFNSQHAQPATRADGENLVVAIRQ